jgi:nucleoside-diphosphate-sugar epimerase
MTAQNLDLKVFGSENYKPLIGIGDLVNFIVFLLNSEYNKEIFHCVNENLKVIDIANICLTYNNINIIHTNEQSPNNGFTLSNQKLLKTGFKFKQSLKEEIGKMINFWKNS